MFFFKKNVGRLKRAFFFSLASCRPGHQKRPWKIWIHLNSTIMDKWQTHSGYHWFLKCFMFIHMFVCYQIFSTKNHKNTRPFTKLLPFFQMPRIPGPGLQGFHKGLSHVLGCGIAQTMLQSHQLLPLSCGTSGTNLCLSCTIFVYPFWMTRWSKTWHFCIYHWSHSNTIFFCVQSLWFFSEKWASLGASPHRASPLLPVSVVEGFGSPVSKTWGLCRACDILGPWAFPLFFSCY